MTILIPVASIMNVTPVSMAYVPPMGPLLWNSGNRTKLKGNWSRTGYRLKGINWKFENRI